MSLCGLMYSYVTSCYRGIVCDVTLCCLPGSQPFLRAITDRGIVKACCIAGCCNCEGGTSSGAIFSHTSTEHQGEKTVKLSSKRC